MSLARLVLIGVVALAAGLAGTPPASAKRIALVAGIDRYDNLKTGQQLEKAVNDARAVGEALEGLGFTVLVQENLGRIAFVRAWSRFLAEIEPGDTAAVFFAGHGVELGGANFLVPRDVPVVHSGEEEVLKAASLRMSALMDGLRDRSPQVSLIILDACRDNPFVTSSGRSLGASRGLARVDPPRGTFVMYSADAGERALDRLPGNDPNPNSVYTRSLVPLLSKPGLGLRDIAVRVRGEVNALARSVGHDQFPAYYDAMTAELYLAGRPQDDTGGAPPSAPVPDRDLARDTAFWNAIEGSDRASDFEAYLEAFPDGLFAPLAETRIAELQPPGSTDVEPAPSAQQAEDALGLQPSQRLAVERSLDRQGYDVGAIDGVFGPNTRRELARLQGALGLARTGYVDEATLAALDRASSVAPRQSSAPRDPTSAQRAEDALRLQPSQRLAVERALDKRGYRIGAIDGVFGPNTRRELARLQGALGLARTGYVDEATLAALDITLTVGPR